MRYVLLLLTILTAGLSVWYYQHKITPEGEALAARKQTMEEAAVTLQQTVNESRTKLNNAQDATRDAELALEKFQAHYLDKKGSSIRKMSMPPTGKPWRTIRRK